MDDSFNLEKEKEKENVPFELVGSKFVTLRTIFYILYKQAIPAWFPCSFPKPCIAILLSYFTIISWQKREMK